MTKAIETYWPLPDRYSNLWLILGAVLFMLSTGSFGVAIAAWVAPVFLIRFLRTQKVGKGYWLALLIGMYVPYAIGWHKILSPFFPLPVYLIFVIFVSMLGSLPYLADRLLAPRIKGFAATLIFPLSMTAVFYLQSLVNPMGSWGTVGYEQYNNLALIQLVSVTGLWGLTFLVGWFGPVANWAWERSFNWPQIQRGLAIWAGIMMAVLIFGGLRLSFADTPLSTVQVRGLNVESDWDKLPDMVTDLEGYRRFTSDRNEQLIQETIRQARNGAQLVLWPEMAAAGVAEDIDQMLARGKDVAVQEDIYLAMGLEIHYPDQEKPWKNKIVVIAPSGEIIIDHDKYGAIFMYAVMGSPAYQGEHSLQTVDTPIGGLSGIVCWDADFPHIVKQAGQQKADILLLANGDDPDQAKVHSQMAIFRAVENGVSLVRQDGKGLSLATDPYGRVLSMVNMGIADQPVMSAQVPTRGVTTVYSYVGDLFGWLSVVGFVLVAAWTILLGRKQEA